MTNTDRLIAYLARVAPHRAADPLDYSIRFRRGQSLQTMAFPWRLARGTVLKLRRRA